MSLRIYVESIECNIRTTVASHQPANMSYTSIFQSIVSEKRWVSTINKTLSKQIAIDITPPPTCIFRVPKTLVDEKPEAYIPSVIGLGPFHHLRPEMHRMMRYKIAAAIRILIQDHNAQQIVVDRLKDIEPHIRSCYHEYLDIDEETLTSMLAIDGLYLLARIGYDQNTTSHVASSDHLAASTSQDNTAKGIDEIKDDKITADQEEIEIKPAEDHIESTVINTISWSSVAKIPEEVMKTPRDIMMLENQIPFIVLNEIVKVINANRRTDRQPKSLDELLQAYCEQHSPLQLLPNVRFQDDTGPAHLLDFMYHLVVCNIKPKHDSRHQHSHRPPEPSKFEGFTTFLNNTVQIISNACSDHLPKPFLLMKNIFLFAVPIMKKESEGGNATSNKVEEIHVPSVSNLHSVAKVMFRLTPGGGIRDIKYDEETLYFYLPKITLKVNSEIIIRNLTAYEQAISPSNAILELTEYIDLMCALINTSKDVEMLRKEGIIAGDLSDDSIVKLFNGIRKHDSHSCGGSEVRKAIFKVRNRFHARPVVKAYVFMKKMAILWWKAIVTISTVVVVLVVIYNQVCSVYNCNLHIFGRSLQRPMISELYGSM